MKKFQVRLIAPMTQKQADAIQRKPGYEGHTLHYTSSGATLKEAVFFFEGSDELIERTHKALSKLKSKNIRVGRTTKA